MKGRDTKMDREKVYLNGSIVAAERALVRASDRGLNYGDGVFETIKASHARPQYLKEHLDRLKKGALTIGMPKVRLAPLLRDIRAGMIGRLLAANGLAKKTAYVKIVVTRGAGRRSLVAEAGLEPTVIMTTGEVDERAVARMRKKGVSAVLVKGLHPAMPGIKTLNYLPNVLARTEAKRRGAYEAIFTTPDGEPTEATGANLFIVERGVLKTPPVSENPGTGVLPGVMRKAVMELAGRLGISVMASRLTQTDLRRCAEAFLTNSTCAVVPLTSVDGVDVGGGSPGPVTQRLQDGLAASWEEAALKGRPA
ncbi:MAG: aminotransferase class IV [Thermodesulfobacteriota bacterium]